MDSLTLSWKLFIYNNTDWVSRKKKNQKTSFLFNLSQYAMNWWKKKREINVIFGHGYVTVPVTLPSK